MGGKPSRRSGKVQAVKAKSHSERDEPRRKDQLYRVWYRHSGEPQVGALPRSYQVTPTDRTCDAILSDVGQHDITHMLIVGEIPPVRVLAPRLCHLGLSALKAPQPLDELSSLESLETLHIYDTDLSAGLPRVISVLSGLKELHIVRCRIDDLPDRFSCMNTLRGVNLSFNDFSNGLPAVISKLEALEELYLRGCNLTDLPKELSSLTQLKKVDLGINTFSAGLPSVIPELKTLVELKLYSCHLSDLPKGLSSLRHLKKLDLINNNFSAGLPSVLSELESLQDLGLRGCKLSGLLPELSSLNQIRQLQLNNNAFSEFPSVISKLRRLNDLKLRNCKLSDLPPELSSLDQLKTLDVGINLFAAGLPRVVTELRTLEELELRNCRLTDLPPELASLSLLQHLDIGYNNFSAGLPSVVFELRALQELKLTYCKLSDLPPQLSLLNQLARLDLSYCDFSAELPSVVSELNTLRELTLVGCKLSDLPQGLSALNQLEKLDLCDNNFSVGLPRVVSELSTLHQLDLRGCKLAELPRELANLDQMEELSLASNRFKYLPTVCYRMKALVKLLVSHNKLLRTVDVEILKLNRLGVLACEGCDSLVSPPKAVCELGTTAIRKYFMDLINDEGVKLTVVPVAVLGNKMAGKTSLLRSLQKGKRVLTFRQNFSPLDEVTKVFNMEELHIHDTELKFVDFGGHDVYQMAYQLTVKDKCVPLIVVNMEEYAELLSARESMEATRKLCFDWLSHLYLACPSLGPPILALTHKDKLTGDNFSLMREKLCSTVEDIRTQLLAEERELTGSSSRFCQISHFTDTSRALFHPRDILEFSNELSDTFSIEQLQKTLNDRSKEFAIIIPKLWYDVGSFLDSQMDKPYIHLDDFRARYPDDDSLIILRYMHNVGKILWYENNESLSNIVFHQIPALTDVIALIFHHCEDDLWEHRISTFTPFVYKQKSIGAKKFESFVEEFRRSGVMDEALLFHLLRVGSSFPEDIALALLTNFFIVHGPIEEFSRRLYIMPYFSKDFMDRSWQCDGELQLRVDILLGGLSLPKYVYQLVSVAVLNQDMGPLHSANVTKNGVTVWRGQCTTHLVHDYNTRKVTLQISTPVEHLSSSWSHLVQLIQYVMEQIRSVWKATHPEFLFYCSHCLFLRKVNPDYQVDPEWFQLDQQQETSQDDEDPPLGTPTFSAMQLVSCCQSGASSSSRNTVPAALRYPCNPFIKDDIAQIKAYLQGIAPRDVNNSDGKTSSEPPVTGHLDAHKAAGAALGSDGGDECDSSEGSATHSERKLEAVADVHDTSAAQAIQRGPQATQGSESIAASRTHEDMRACKPSAVADDDGSDLSDVEDRGYCDDSIVENTRISLRTEATREQSIRRLFDNTEKVYRMSDGVRGRVLIINIETVFTHPSRGSERTGSRVDYDNMSRMFKALGFVVAKTERELTDLTAQEIYSEIREETQREDHFILGMFVFVVMSHGTRGDILYDYDSRPVDLAVVKDLLSPGNFPAMKGKPKLMIVQACSGERSDQGDNQPVPPHAIPASFSKPVGGPAEQKQLTVLNVDDFLVMKASSESYIATRSPTHGSWFIRILVATFYRHANHRDVEALFKIIQERVRRVSLTHPRSPSGNVPVSVCTFTNYRKLYLFPGYPVQGRH